MGQTFGYKPWSDFGPLGRNRALPSCHSSLYQQRDEESSSLARGGRARQQESERREEESRGENREEQTREAVSQCIATERPRASVVKDKKYYTRYNIVKSICEGSRRLNPGEKQGQETGQYDSQCTSRAGILLQLCNICCRSHKQAFLQLFDNSSSTTSVTIKKNMEQEALSTSRHSADALNPKRRTSTHCLHFLFGAIRVWVSELTWDNHPTLQVPGVPTLLHPLYSTLMKWDNDTGGRRRAYVPYSGTDPSPRLRTRRALRPPLLISSMARECIMFFVLSPLISRISSPT